MAVSGADAVTTENRLLDGGGTSSFNRISSGVPVALIGQEGIRCVSPFRRRVKSGAAPATVGGEPFSEVPLGFAVQSLGKAENSEDPRARRPA